MALFILLFLILLLIWIILTVGLGNVVLIMAGILLGAGFIGLISLFTKDETKPLLSHRPRPKPASAAEVQMSDTVAGVITAVAAAFLLYLTMIALIH
jgi:hypothetical protein